jgi:rhamnogalacturonan endolyase
VDDKYQYSLNNMDNVVHGWMTGSDPNPMGFWVITPSNEFKSGGPIKRELTSHVGPTSLTVSIQIPSTSSETERHCFIIKFNWWTELKTLWNDLYQMFLGTHYVGKYIVTQVGNGEYWKKVLGPVFIYLNSSPLRDLRALWEDAKSQSQTEARKWPYNFLQSPDFPKADMRGSITGRLFVRDKFVSKEDMPAGMSYVGLALPGEPGSWATEGKGYQFWTRVTTDGTFNIANVREGMYNLYAWVPGFLGDCVYNSPIAITPGVCRFVSQNWCLSVQWIITTLTSVKSIATGRAISVGDLVFEPPRLGPTLWEIGVPDRTPAEFYIPDPDPKYINRLFVNVDRSGSQHVFWVENMKFGYGALPEFALRLTGIGNTVCGRDTLPCTRKMIWSSLLVKAIHPRTGSLHKSQGNNTLLLPYLTIFPFNNL